MSGGPKHLTTILRAIILSVILIWMPLQADVVTPSQSSVRERDRAESDREGRRRIEQMEGGASDENRIPTPVGEEYKVDRGETITIELKTLGDAAAQAIHFIIKEEPLAGKLSKVRFLDTARSRAEVDYTADADSIAPNDRFTFSAQYPNGRVSAPQRVNIEIIQPAPALVAPSSVDFGRTMMGVETTLEVSIENEGNSYFEGAFNLSEPFAHVRKPGEPRKVRIDPGETQTLTFRFKPTHQGMRIHRMPFPASEEGSIRFTGEGYVPFTLSGPEVKLTYDPSTRSRRGVLSVRANKSSGVPLFVDDVDDRLYLWAGQKFWLEGRDLINVVMQLNSGDTAAFENEVVVNTGGYERKVRIWADPSPAYIIHNGHPVIDFGKIEAGGEIRKIVEISNWGGADGSIVCPVMAPYHLVGDFAEGTPIPVPANTTLELEFAFRPPKPGSYQRTFNLDAGEQSVLLIFEGEGLTSDQMAEFADLRGSDKGTFGSTGHYAAASPANRGSSGGGTYRPNSAATGSRDGHGPNAGGSRANPYAEMAKGRNRDAAASRNLSEAELKRRTLILKEIKPVIRGVTGQIPLPKTLARDGLLAISPFKLKTDATLPRIAKFEVSAAEPKKVSLMFSRPRGRQTDYALELRTTRYNQEKKRFEAIWIPYEKVKFFEHETFVAAEVTGLQPDGFYLMRLFTMGENGTNSLPSVEIGVQTTVERMEVGMQMLIGLVALIVVSVAGMVMYIKHTGLA